MRDMVGRFIGEGIGVGIIGSFDTVRKDIAAFNDSLIDEFNKSDSFGCFNDIQCCKRSQDAANQ